MICTGAAYRAVVFGCLLLTQIACSDALPAQTAAGSTDGNAATPNPEERIGQVQAALIQAYPEAVRPSGSGSVALPGGLVLAIDDGRIGKTVDQLHDAPDLEDMFHWRYPAGPQTSAPDGDPGRIRQQAFFDSLYGNCLRGEVAGQLVDVRWYTGTVIRFHRAQGAAAALQRVSDELGRLPAGRSAAARATSGTYNCRTIDGTPRRSMHAYGVAIDLSTAHGEYWRWSGQPEGRVVWRNRFPYAVVEVFERHGFVWGGRWSHYDTFHFEYRPEIAAFARLAR